MKTGNKKIFAILLAMALCCQLCVAAFAENGPFDEEFEGWYLSFLTLYELDENDEPLFNEDGTFITQELYSDKTASSFDGAVYDRKSNTLTLTDFNKRNCALIANMMGDDFTVRVVGDCSLAGMTLYGDGWGASLRVTGDGTLKVNGKKLSEYGLVFLPEGCEVRFTVDSGCKVDIYGSEAAILAYGSDKNFTVTAGGKTVNMKKENAVREEDILLRGYSNPGTTYLRLCSKKDDPDGIYSITRWTDEKGESYVTVERFIYCAKYDLYLKDFSWNADESGLGGTIRFDTYADANEAGYEYVLNEYGLPQSIEVNSLLNYTLASLFTDAAGKEYVVCFGPDDSGNYGRFAYTFEPLEGVEDVYIFSYAPGVDPTSLELVTKTVEYDDYFDYSFPGKTFSFDGKNADSGFLIGDVDGDGSVLAGDARYALRAAVGLDDTAEGLDFSSNTNRCFMAADITGDKVILAEDARLILRAAVGLCDLKDKSTW